MDVKFSCWKCQQPLAAPEAARGADIVCPNCNATVVVPVQSDPLREPPRVGGFDPRAKFELSEAPSVSGQPVRVVITDVQLSFRTVLNLLGQWIWGL
jgi:hypothetical protein